MEPSVSSIKKSGWGLVGAVVAGVVVGFGLATGLVLANKVWGKKPVEAKATTETASTDNV